MTSRALAIALGLLVILAAPLAEAEGRGTPPGHEKNGKAEPPAPATEPTPAEPAPPPGSNPSPDPEPTPAPASSPAPQPVIHYTMDTIQPAAPTPAPRPERESARLLAIDMGSCDLPAFPCRTSAASIASVPVATRTAPSVPDLPAWAWLLPAIGLVSVGLAVARPIGRGVRRVRAGATLLVVRKGRAQPTVVVAAERRPAMRFANADVPSLLRAGKEALDEGRIEEAVAWFTQAAKLDPRLPVAHFSRGVCLASLGQHDEAYRALKKAHLLDPMEGAYRLELARAGARTGHGAEAMTLLASLIAVLPELAGDVAADDAFASLLDHPRFLLMVGRL